VERSAAAEAEREAARHRNSGLVVVVVATPEVQTASHGERRRARPMRDAGFFSSFLCFLDGEWGIGRPCFFFFHVGLGYSTRQEEEPCICLELGSTKRPDHEPDC
jgi:hypothetical protein